MRKMLNFYSYAPSIDLHGMDREYAVFIAKEFIQDQYKLKNNTVRIIHGVGSGILRSAIHEYLKHEKIVKEFKTNYNNSGETIIILNIEK